MPGERGKNQVADRHGLLMQTKNQDPCLKSMIRAPHLCASEIVPSSSDVPCIEGKLTSAMSMSLMLWKAISVFCALLVLEDCVCAVR